MASEDTARIDRSGLATAYPEDLALVERCVAGDRSAWGELLTAHESVIHFTVRSVLSAHMGFAPDHVVEDVQADVVLALVSNGCARLQSWKGQCKLRSWIKVVAHHLAVDRLRRKARRTVSLDESWAPTSLRETLRDEGPGPEHQVAERDCVARLFALAQALPQEDQDFLRLFVTEGLEFPEIAARMDATMGAVYARKNRVRKKLAQMYAGDCQIAVEEPS